MPTYEALSQPVQMVLLSADLDGFAIPVQVYEAEGKSDPGWDFQ